MLYWYLCKKGLWDTIFVTYFTKAEHQVTTGLQKVAFFCLLMGCLGYPGFSQGKPTSRFILFLNQDITTNADS